MNNRKYDIKLSPLFNGSINYTREDYLTDIRYYYSFNYTDGELSYVAIYLKTFDEKHHVDYKDVKFPDVSKYNGDFWLKAPKFLHFDDCRWEREHIIFDKDIVTCQPLGLTCIP